MISIAMATYNGAKYIREQLDSLLIQTIPFDELIVCDDCSIDDSSEILKEYAAQDSRIKVYINEQNLGFNNNFQKAISICKGEYIALCDQDDIWLPHHIEVLKDLLYSGALLAAGGTKFIDSEGNILSDRTMAQTRNFPYSPDMVHEDIFRFICGYMNPFQGASMMVKKEFLNIALPLPKSAYIYDVWFSLCASLLGGLSFNPEIISLWRRHRKNATANILYHNPMRTLLGHIAKPGPVNRRGELLEELNTRLTELNPESRALLDEALEWNSQRYNLRGRLRNSLCEYRFWRHIQSRQA